MSTDTALNRFALWLPISLILNGYASGIPGVSLGSACFIIFVISALFRNKWNINLISLLAIITTFAFLLLSLFDFTLYYLPSPVSFLTSFSKILIWCMFICCVAPTYYNLFYIEKWFTRFGIILTIYLIIQNIGFYGLGIYFPNIFKFGPLQPYAEGYANYDVLSEGSMIRPASLLSESSFLGNYLMLNLALVLQRLKYVPHKRDILLCLFFTFGILLSSSTSAIVLTAAIWVILGWNILRRYKFVTFTTLTAAAFYFSINQVSLDQFSNGSQVDAAIFETFNKLNYMDSNVRFGKSYRMIDEMSPAQLVTGVGIGNSQTFISPFIRDDYQYLNSITVFIIESGIIGAIFLTVLFLAIFLAALRQRNRLAMTLLVLYVVKVFGSGFLFNTYGVLYIFVIIGSIVNPVRKFNPLKYV